MIPLLLVPVVALPLAGGALYLWRRRPMSSSTVTIADLTRSATATREGIPNDPTPTAAANLVRTAALASRVLDHYGLTPSAITSGYRSPALNAVVGGVNNSPHTLGEAFDFRPYAMRPATPADARALGDWMTGQGIEWDQVMCYADKGHLHVSARASGNRRQVLMRSPKVGGGYVYEVVP